MTSHTPTPWYASGMYEDGSGAPGYISIGDYELTAHKPAHYEDTICEVWAGEHDASANAAFIVRACNAHSDLVNALRTTEIWLRKTHHGDLADEILEMIAATLAKAGAE